MRISAFAKENPISEGKIALAVEDIQADLAREGLSLNEIYYSTIDLMDPNLSLIIQKYFDCGEERILLGTIDQEGKLTTLGEMSNVSLHNMINFKGDKDDLRSTGLSWDHRSARFRLYKNCISGNSGNQIDAYIVDIMVPREHAIRLKHIINEFILSGSLIQVQVDNPNGKLRSTNIIPTLYSLQDSDLRVKSIYSY
jgi:hypothetical protein